MFWTILKWGATGALLCMLVVGLIASSNPDDRRRAEGAHPNDSSAQSTDTPPPKKFNF
jgi:hypothetical protein